MQNGSADIGTRLPSNHKDQHGAETPCKPSDCSVVLMPRSLLVFKDEAYTGEFGLSNRAKVYSADFRLLRYTSGEAQTVEECVLYCNLVQDAFPDSPKVLSQAQDNIYCELIRERFLASRLLARN